ncbi:hypothetical protein BDR04DRAFT_710259 [Suillus decipiens]|nr:hypothetical protein BDR04DRAFT_710259 [Suillus decipiens]
MSGGNATRHLKKDEQGGERPSTQRCRQPRKNARGLRKRIGNDGESRKKRGEPLKRHKIRESRKFWRRVVQLSILTQWVVQDRSAAVGDTSSGKASETCSLILSSNQVCGLIPYRWCP